MVTKTKSVTKVFFVGILMVVAIAFSSCAKKMMFEKSAIVPGAQGYVKMSKDDNSNYSVKVYMTNLADPDKLTPSKKEYVVWLVIGDEVKNVGKINTGTSMFSKQLKGFFETVSSSKPGKLFISAEDDANVTYPGSVVVLTTSSF